MLTFGTSPSRDGIPSPSETLNPPESCPKPLLIACLGLCLGFSCWGKRKTGRNPRVWVTEPASYEGSDTSHATSLPPVSLAPRPTQWPHPQNFALTGFVKTQHCPRNPCSPRPMKSELDQCQTCRATIVLRSDILPIPWNQQQRTWKIVFLPKRSHVCFHARRTTAFWVAQNGGS